MDTLFLPNVDQLPTGKVKLSSVLAAGSPRLSGENLRHSRILAASEDQFPPIIVHRPTMRVIDGMHRLHAAELRGELEIEVRFFDGDDAMAFVLAVRANVMHGLPLTLADRKAAARRVMKLYPQWSDRMIASVTGLAAKTVAGDRKRLTGKRQQLDTRVGRDGRIRPMDSAERREIAAKFIADHPQASVREVGRQAGVSPETARRVRATLNSEHEKTPTTRRNGYVAAEAPKNQNHEGRYAAVSGARQNGGSSLKALMADPALRYTNAGRVLIRLLIAQRILDEQGRIFIENIPPHCIDKLADAVKECVRAWGEFSSVVEQRRHGLRKLVKRAMLLCLGIPWAVVDILNIG
jgi:hypothetical protein